LEPYKTFKRQKFVTTAPSELANPSKYRSIQNSGTLDDHPKPDVDMPPIPLLYDGFGYFLDIVAGHKDIPGLDLVDLRRLQAEVDELACMMCRFYDHENERRDVACRILNKIFGARRGVVIPLIEAASIGSVRSDGHVMWRNGVVMLVTDFKNKATGSYAMLKVELVRHVARFHKQKMQEGKRGWRVPCLGLIIIGEREYLIFSFRTELMHLQDQMLNSMPSS
jgi:hypothetical protein